jgi:DNA repair protein RadC
MSRSDPSHALGVVDPSREDHTFTQRIYAGAELLGLRFLNSIIVGDGHYFSFYDEGLLKRSHRPEEDNSLF